MVQILTRRGNTQQKDATSAIWTGIDSATSTATTADFGIVYAVNTGTAAVTVTLQSDDPIEGNTIGIFDWGNSWDNPNDITVNPPAGHTINGQTSFNAGELGNGRVIEFIRLEDPVNPGTYLTDWLARISPNAAEEMTFALAANPPDPAQYKAYIESDTSLLYIANRTNATPSWTQV